MNFFRTIIHGFLIVGMILMAGVALATNNDPLPVEVGKGFTVHMNGGKDCNNAKPNDHINLLVKGIDTGIHPIGCDPANNNLTFELRRDPTVQNTAASNAAWEAMLGSPWKSNPGFIRPLSFTVTQPAASGIEAIHSGTLNLRLLNPDMAFWGTALVVIVWLSLIYLGRNSGLVRDAGNPGTTLDHRTYSLGRVQMAWWFAIILASYIFLWVVTGGMPVLSTQALSLMGISGASGLVSSGLDNSKQTVFPISSGNFFTDLLTDADGVTIHRFQMLTMTIIFGFIFIIEVFTQLKMPEFDSNTLALMGISGLTYVGFKVPEQHVDAVVNKAANSTISGSDPKQGYSPLPEPPAK